jgi:hypothetical protein
LRAGHDLPPLAWREALAPPRDGFTMACRAWSTAPTLIAALRRGRPPGWGRGSGIFRKSAAAREGFPNFTRPPLRPAGLYPVSPVRAHMSARYAEPGRNWRLDRRPALLFPTNCLISWSGRGESNPRP